MKRILLFIFLLYITVSSSEAPFNRGVNLTEWIQKSNAREIQFTKYTKDDFVNLKELGCDHIRLPINLHFMTNGAPDYAIDSLFLFFLDQVVDWAEELQLHLVLDNHTFDPAVDTDPNIDQILLPVWRQMVNHYKNRSTYLYYEVLNEPHGISDARWNEIQQDVVDAIREIDQKHTIIIGPAGWNSFYNLKYMPVYSDTNLIYTFHFYDPFLFTHQGASWTNPSMGSLYGVPFPYDAAKMPDCPVDLKGTWIEGSLNNYKNDGTVERVKELIDIAVNFKNQRNVPMLCGEFGVYIPNSNNSDRVNWHQVVREYLEEKGIAWSLWEYEGGFGLFEPGSNALFDYDLNIPIVEALGFTAPPQGEYIQQPDTTGFNIYLDYIENNIFESGWVSEGTLDYYSNYDPCSGSYCIYYTDVAQYNDVGFDFKPNRDLSKLVEGDYEIYFWVRGDSPGAEFDIRFIDTKTESPDDHPWRMRYTINESVAEWNGEWNHVQIPLENFTEQGSWDNAWFEPVGNFDWKDIDEFEIVSEHHDLKDIQFWFDNIRIIDPKTINIDSDNKPVGSFKLHQNYPNPFNPKTTISYQIPTLSQVDLSVFNTLGQKVATLVSEKQPAGNYKTEWDISRFERQASGIYLYRLKTDQFIQTKKMVLMK